MKTMKTMVMLILILQFNAVFSQDTIYMKDQKVLTGKVKEISSKRLTMRKSKNLSGPLYSILTDKIEKVKFENGAIKTFNAFGQKSINDSSEWKAAGNQKIAGEEVTRQSNLDKGNQSESEELSYHQKSGNFLSSKNFGLNVKLQKDPFIKQEYKKAKIYEKCLAIGFLAIPLTYVAYNNFVAAKNTYDNASARQKYNEQALISLAGSFACVGISLHLNSKRNYHLKRASDAYTERFNRDDAEIRAEKKMIEAKRFASIQFLGANRFLHEDRIYSKLEMEEVLLAKSIPDINRVIRNANKSKKWQWVGLIDIPLTIAGVAIVSDVFEKNFNYNPQYKRDQVTTRYQVASALFIAGSACFTIGMAHHDAYRKGVKRASQLYNLNYVL